jgi:uncharacterized protein YgiM (DUF1202 family)
MKKSLLFIIFVLVLTLAGCGKKEQMTNFIPTPMPESEEDSETSGEDAESTEEDGSESSEEGAEATPTPKALHVGKTTTMYVKLDKYNAILNVRKAPSKDGEVVGFLVHTEKIEVIEIVDGWASFAQGGEIRYVSADFLVKDRPDYIDPPTPLPTNKPTPTSKPVQNDTPDTDAEEAPPEI